MSKTKKNRKTLKKRMALIEMYREDEKEMSEQKKANKGGVKSDEKIPVTTYDMQEDNRKTLIHKASLLHLPVSEQETWYKKVPLALEQTVKSIPLKSTGSEHAMSDIAIEKMHDHSNSLCLKYFISKNISINSRPPRETWKYGDNGLSTTTELAWEQAATISQATEAVISYGCILQQLWPTDTTGWALIRLYNR